MQKIGFLLGILIFCVAAQAQNVSWVLRLPSTGVKEGETIRIELMGVNAHQKTEPFDAPATLTGELVNAGDKSKVELKRVSDPAKFVPSGGFAVVAYDMVVPSGVGERVLHVRSPIEVNGVMTVIAAAPATTQSIVPEPVVVPFAPPPTTTAATGLTLTAPATEPAAPIVGPEPLTHTEPGKRVPTTSDSGVVEFVRNKLSPYERMYFLIGNESPSAKFQISFKYQLFNEQADVAINHPWVNGFYLGYTQTSFWDLTADSAPFFDNTYRPELFWATNDIRIANAPDLFRFDFQTGVQHESNGKGGDDSRTINSIYLQPAFTLGDKDAFFFTFAPRGYIYISSLADNPDITHYRGYFDLKFILGQADGLQAAVTGRIGDDWDKGSAQLDVSYPARKLGFNWFDVYLHTQIFSGYGESLLNYNKQDTTFRFGLSLVR